MSFTLEKMMRLPLFLEAYFYSGKVDLDNKIIEGIVVLVEGFFLEQDLKNKIALTNMETLSNILKNKDNSKKINSIQLPPLCLMCSKDDLLLLETKYKNLIDEYTTIIILPQQTNISNVITAITYEIIKDSTYNVRASFEENFFQELIFSENLDEYEKCIKKANMLGIRSDEHLVLITLKASDEKLTDNIVCFLRDKQIKKLYLLSKNNIILIILQTSVLSDLNNFTIKNAKKILGFLIEKFNNVSFKMGIGNFYNNFSSLKKMFYEARVALIMNTIYEKPNSILKFDELGIYSIIFDYENKVSLYYFYYNYLGRILEFDKNNDTDYFKTIATLIDSEFSVNKTKKKLFVHYNTVLNKIKKIKEIFKLDLNSQTSKMDVIVAFTIYKFLKKDNNIFDQ